MILQIRDDGISFHLDEKHKVMHISDENISIQETDEDDESWVYHISHILSDHPDSWKEYIDKKYYYSIIKMEFDELTKCKAKIEADPTVSKEHYKTELLLVASACILAFNEC